MQRDVWHHVDWEIFYGGADQNDGYVRLFLNGVEVVYIRNLNLTRTNRLTEAPYTNMIHWRPILGGGGASNTRDMGLYFRNFQLRGQ